MQSGARRRQARAGSTSLMLGDGVPDGHVIGGQVQLVGTGQRVVAGKGSARAGTGSSSR